MTRARADDERAPFIDPKNPMKRVRVLRRLAAGDPARGAGAALLASLGTLAMLTEADELERRIVALEAHRD
jgi:hypothetical protein